MNDLLQEIKMLQGVLGVFVYAEQKGIIARDVPATFRDPALTRMGKFSNTFFSNRIAQQQHFSSFEMKNDETLLLLKKIDNMVYLVTICEPTVSMPLLNMTTSMLLAEIKAAVVAKSRPVAPPAPAAPKAAAPAPVSPTPVAPPQPSAAPPAPPTPPPAQPPAAVNVEKLMNEGPFAAIARKLEDAMSRAIGPVGAMVVRDCVEKWVAGGPPAKNRFNELLALLIIEVGDPALEEDFRKEVGSLFG